MPEMNSTLRWEPYSPACDAALPKGSETVLVVEYHEVLRTTISKVLRESGFTALEAPNGDEALLMCMRHEGPIHLLLTNVVMPGMSGTELFTSLTSVQPELSVLYMSGYPDDVIVHYGVLDRGVVLLRKPFTRNILLRKTREVLRTPILEPKDGLEKASNADPKGKLKR